MVQKSRKRKAFGHIGTDKRVTAVRSSREVASPLYSDPNKPWDAVVVGIDPGKRDGVSVFLRGDYCESATVVEAIKRAGWVILAYEIARRENIPLIFVAETWPSAYLPSRKRMSHKSILGMGAGFGRWEQEILKLPKPNGLPKTQIVRVASQKWRKAFGLHRYHREDAKREAVKLFSAMFDKSIADHNQAEAVGIGYYGTKAPECYIAGLERRE